MAILRFGLSNGKMHSVHNAFHSTALERNFRGTDGTLRINLGDHFITIRQWSGSGPEIVLIHGIGSSGASWESVASRLSATFTPLALDLRGHGESGKPEHGYLYDDYIDDLDGVFQALKLRHPLIIGHSLGGIVALWWAARHPDRAAGIVVVDSPLRSGQDFMPAFDTWLAQNAMTIPELAARYRELHPDWTVERATHRAGIMTGTARNVFAELRADSLAHDGIDRIPEIEHITSPVLLVHGDPETGSQVHPADAEAFARCLANARVFRVQGAGHSLHRERTVEFLDLAVPFLRNCASTNAHNPDS